MYKDHKEIWERKNEVTGGNVFIYYQNFVLTKSGGFILTGTIKCLINKQAYGGKV